MYHFITTTLTAPTLPRIIGRSLTIYFLLTVSAVTLMILADYAVVHIWEAKSIMGTKEKMGELLTRYGMLGAFFFVAILIPLIEETIFRLGLFPNRLFVAVSLALFLFLVTCYAEYGDNYLAYSIGFIVCICLGGLLYGYVQPDDLQAFFDTYRDGLLLVSSVVFAAMHITNFDPVQHQVLFLYPVYVLPQFFMGLILGWLRMQHGFWWAVLFHALVNGIAIGLSALS